MKRFLQRTLLVAVSAGAALLLAEGLVRWLDPFGISYWRDFGIYQRHAPDSPPGAWRPDGRLFQHRPGLALELRRFDLFTDGLGLRAPAPGLPAPAERPAAGAEGLRILFLGDSVTLGWGVDDEDTWVRVLEREGRAPSGAPLECLNAGHMTYDSVQEADLLATLGPVLRPDVVAVMFIVNDVVSTYDAVVLQTPAAGAAEVTPSSSRLERLLGERFRGLRGVARYFRLADDLALVDQTRLPKPAGYPAGWPRSAAALEAMRNTCEALGATLVVLDHTMPNYPEVAAWCEAAGVLRIDTTFTPEEWRRPIRNSAVDAHANALGNRMIAEKALAGLRAAGLLAR